jgi:hypothetical protein
MTLNLTIGLLVMILCLIIQCMVVTLLLKTLQRLDHRRILKPTFVRFVVVLSVSMLVLLIGNLLQISVWAALFLGFGEFPDFNTAFYHSTVNFSTLGYGDMVMSPDRRLLGALEAASGVMMFGLSTSVMISVVNAMVRKMREQRKA